MNEIEETDNHIDDYKLLFISSNKEKFNFNIFRVPINLLSEIYNGEISLKEAEIFQRKIEKKLEETNGYRPENAEEKGEITGVLVQANDMLE